MVGMARRQRGGGNSSSRRQHELTHHIHTPRETHSSISKLHRDVGWQECTSNINNVYLHGNEKWALKKIEQNKLHENYFHMRKWWFDFFRFFFADTGGWVAKLLNAAWTQEDDRTHFSHRDNIYVQVQFAACTLCSRVRSNIFCICFVTRSI